MSDQNLFGGLDSNGKIDIKAFRGENEPFPSEEKGEVVDSLPFDFDMSEPNKEKIVLEFIVVVKKKNGTIVFKHFDAEPELFKYASDLASGNDKVHKLFSLDSNGVISFKTIGFKDGKLVLITVED